MSGERMPSETHPIYADFVPEEHAKVPGRLGMTFAPGMKTRGQRGRWDRDLKADLRVLREEYAADVLVSVMEEHEYHGYKIPELFEQDLVEGVEVHRFAIEDMNVPKEAEAEEYEELIRNVVDRMREGQNIVVHCRGGLGRTGTVAACVLVALGEHSADESLEMTGGVFGWAPGETTDDTALAKAVLEGYRNGTLDLGCVRDAMLRWRDTDPRDIGNQTRKALDYLGHHPEVLSLPEEPEAQGNGAVMRAPPHGVMTRNPKEAFDNAFAEAGLTHPSWEARTSAALVACVVAHLVEGVSPAEVVESAYCLTEDDEAGRNARCVFAPLSEYHHDPGGWTVYTTRLALRCLLDAEDFRSGVERVVRLAGDADTNGAVAGALLGAHFGASAIPASWLEAPLRGDELLDLL